jgi:ABC-type lipoprotein release transport system permease subunit
VLASYALKSLLARIRANTLTILAIALLVVGGTLGVAFESSLANIVVDAAPPENIIVMSDGAIDETDSTLDRDHVEKIAVSDGVAKRDGKPLVSRELVGHVYLNTSDGSDAPTVIRGVDDLAMTVDHVTMIAGKQPQIGSLEIMIGRRVARQFPDLTIGSEIVLKAGASRISGIFEARGAAYEDEVWMLRPGLELDMESKNVSSVNLVMESAAARQAILTKINASKDLAARALALTDYREAGAGLHTIVRIVLVMLLGLAIVVTFAIAMTMNAAVAVRIPELAVLAAIGLRTRVLARTIVFESMLLGFAGAVLGLVASELVRRQIATVSLGEIPVDLEFSLVALVVGFALGIAVGLFGAIKPALTTRRLSILEALR